MTSQTLIPSGLSGLPSSTGAVHQLDSTFNNTSGSNSSVLEVVPPCCQSNPQAELQNLQEATAALLRQLQTLKQERLASVQPESIQPESVSNS
jgi:flagellar biosynthesis/type III secretory pathway chaperone